MLACLASGCGVSDAPAPRPSSDHDTVEHARDGEPTPGGSRDPAEDLARAALDAADAADEFDGDELEQVSRAASADMSPAAVCDDDPLGSFDYCSATCICGPGEGDCDDDGDCEAGLACMRDTGALFGFDPEVDVCMDRCSPNALGTPDFCSSECPCEPGHGDCDRDSDCADDGVCAKNVGAAFGFAPDVDVCVDACDPVLNGTFDYCSSECLCEAGLGDCDRNSDCAPGHVCARDVGASYGFDPEMDVCEVVQVPRESFTGRVIDKDGRLVSGATVSINQLSMVTGDDGAFELAIDIPADRRYVINVEKFGYVPYSGIYADTGMTDMVLIIDEAEMISIPLGAADIGDRQGTRIALDVPIEEALVDANGEPPRGTVLAQMHTFDVVGEGMVGNMEAVDRDGNPITLQSVGALSVDFVDLDGNKYQLRPGQTAEISMELPPEIQYSGPIPLWHYDMEQGRWVEEGEGRVQDGVASGVVSHFSAWNFDVKVATPSCIKVTTTGLPPTSSFEARVVISPPSPFPRSQIVSLNGGDNVLFNLPNGTDVDIFVPPDAPSRIGRVNSGDAWGGVGRPTNPEFDLCQGSIILAAPPGQVRGILTLQGRTNHAGATITLRSDTTVLTAETDEDGRYTFPSVAAQIPPYTVELSQPGYLSMELQVTVKAGKVHYLPCVGLPAGDVQEDGDIDFEDQEAIQERFGSVSGGDFADYNKDGSIDTLDLGFLVPNIGKAEPLALSQVECPSGVVASVAAGGNHTCAVMGDGRVRCWGGNALGQLGYGTVANVGDDETLISVEQNSMSDSVIKLASGGFHSCVVVGDAASNRDVRCWGYNLSGQLGYGHTNSIGDTETSATVVDVALALSTGDSVAAVTTGLFHTCARSVQGKVYCWGDNTYGQLGYGNTNNIGDDASEIVATPVNVGGNVLDVVAGAYHTCALLDDVGVDVRVRCWGYNQFGQLGYGNAPRNIGDDEEPADATVPSPLVMSTTPNESVRKLVAGLYHTCAQFSTGFMRCWGSGDFGQLGYGDTNDIGDDELGSSGLKVAVAGAFGSFELVAGGFHTCALISNAGIGEVKCWGRSNFGQLGFVPSSGGNQLGPPTTTVPLGAVSVIGLSAGLSHTCAVLATQNVMCWGRSNFGQLGYGNTNNIGDDEPLSSAGTVPFLD